MFMVYKSARCIHLFNWLRASIHIRIYAFDPLKLTNKHNWLECRYTSVKCIHSLCESVKLKARVLLWFLHKKVKYPVKFEISILEKFYFENIIHSLFVYFCAFKLITESINKKYN